MDIKRLVLLAGGLTVIDFIFSMLFAGQWYWTYPKDMSLLYFGTEFLVFAGYLAILATAGDIIGMKELKC